MSLPLRQTYGSNSARQTYASSGGKRMGKVTIAAGVIKPISGPSVDGFGKNLFLRNNVIKLRAQRDAYKAKRMKAGKTSRFGNG
jgi:hypothetical protein